MSISDFCDFTWTLPFTASAEFYDAIYTKERDYAEQATQLARLVNRFNPAATSLLDVACGTGLHLEPLSQLYNCEGLDKSPQVLEFARRRNPTMAFHQGDMRQFSTGRTY